MEYACMRSGLGRVCDEILITPRVRLVPKNTLPKSEGKAVRVVDTRKKY